jgi:choice-of-anchor B domain-containing protein
VRRLLLPLLAGALLGLAWLGAGAQESSLPLPGGGNRPTPAPRGRSCGCAHACGPATYQGCGCGSVKCFPGGSRLGSASADTAALETLARLNAPAPCEEGLAAGTFACRATELLGLVTLTDLHPAAVSGSNLWGFSDLEDGREYAVVGHSAGTTVVEVTDPVHPRVVGRADGNASAWREVKVYQIPAEAPARRRIYAYVTTEAAGSGLQILDLSELPDSISLAATATHFQTSHTITIANVDLSTGAQLPGGPEPVLYVQGARPSNFGATYALGLADPTSPAVLGTYDGSYTHDSWVGRVSGERARGCQTGHDPCDIVVLWTGMDITILDWTAKASPVVLSHLTYPELGYAHSGWISRDGRYLFSMDEFDEMNTGKPSRVRVIDVSDWRSPRLAGEWDGATTAIEHNGYTIGNLYYVAHYARGLTLLDVRDPLHPFEAAFFDTFPESDVAQYHGSWGVYPFLPSGTILLSNYDGGIGLFAVRHTPVSGDAPRAPVVPAPPRARTPRVVDAPRPIP